MLWIIGNWHELIGGELMFAEDINIAQQINYIQHIKILSICYCGFWAHTIRIQ